MPRVSVIIPAYNPGRFLDVAVRSVIAQTFVDWELIIIDDGGSEDLAQVPLIDSRIRLIRQENRGTSAARNAGVLLAQGDLIAFLDHDDYWHPTKLERQVEVMTKDRCLGLCYTNFEIVDGQERHVRDGYSVSINSYVDLLAKNGGPCLSTAMVRKHCLVSVGLFDPLYPGIQDYDLFLKLSRHFGMAFVPTCEAAYRLHGNNTSGKYMMVYREIENLAQKHWAFAYERREHDVMAAIRQLVRNARPTYGAQAFDKARSCLRARKYREFFVHFGRSVRLAPVYVARPVLMFGFNLLLRRRPASSVQYSAHAA